MNESVERTSFDLRYQTYRLRNDTTETRLLASIAEHGIEQPLGGVDTPQGHLLLDGFKRYRCATKLGIECLPYASLGEEEAMGIACLMRVTKDKTLSILSDKRPAIILGSIPITRLSATELILGCENCTDSAAPILNPCQLMIRLLVS